MTRDEAIALAREHCAKEFPLAKWTLISPDWVIDAIMAAAQPRQWSEAEAVDLALQSGFAGTCWTMGPEELVHLLGMAAQPVAPAIEPIGYLCRHVAEVAQQRKAFPGDDPDYLWKYTHGTKGLADFEAMDHLEVQRVYATPQVQPVAPAPPTFPYSGELYARPLGRGACLMGLDGQPGLEDILPEGDYTVEIRATRDSQSPAPAKPKP